MWHSLRHRAIARRGSVFGHVLVLMRFFPHYSLGPEEERIEPEDAVDVCPQLAVLQVCARALLEKYQNDIRREYRQYPIAAF